MSRLTTDERTKLVWWSFENHKSVVNTQRAYKINYKTRDAPTSRTIGEVVKRFQEKGTVADRERCGLPKSMRTPQNIEKLRKKYKILPDDHQEHWRDSSNFQEELHGESSQRI